MVTQPIVLEMDVHCHRCAKKIRRSLTNMLGAFVLAVACMN